MTKTKIFWLTFVCTVAIFLPIYLLSYAFTNAQNSTQPQTVTEQQSDILITNPTPDDVHTILLMIGTGTADTADAYMLVHFYALINVICVTSMPPQSVVLIGEYVMTLKQALAKAGASNGAAALSQTLGIQVTDYAFASPNILSDIAQIFGNVTLMLDNYISEEVLTQLGFVHTQSQRYTVSPEYFNDILQMQSISQQNIHELRSLGYSAFLAAGHGRLSDIITGAISQNSKNMATNITATKLFNYERTLTFIDKQQPTYHAMAMPGDYSANEERFELNEQSVEFMRLAFNGLDSDIAQISGEDEEKIHDPEQDEAFAETPEQQSTAEDEPQTTE